MLIVLEGCDGVGKTTLAKALASILSAEIIHCNRCTPNTHKFFSDIIFASKERNIIADRFCYGQFVYQKPAYRNLIKDGLYDLETQMLDAGSQVIYVTAPMDEIKQRLSYRGEITDPTVEEICEGYDSLFHNSMLPIKVWNNGGRGLEMLKDYTLQTIFDFGGIKNE